MRVVAFGPVPACGQLGFGKDGTHGAGFQTGFAVDAPIRVDEQLAGGVEARFVRRGADGIHGADLDTGIIRDKRFGGGTAVQHLRAKAILEASGLPLTYINIASYFMQNFLTPFFNGAIQAERTLAVPRNRRMGFIDTADIGACAAAILLSDNQRHIGQTYHLDNGNDVLWFDEVAELMSQVFGEQIGYDGSDEAFLRFCGEGVKQYIGRPDAPEYFLHYFQFEQDNETVWRKSDIVEYLTGRAARTLADWLVEHQAQILGC